MSLDTNIFFWLNNLAGQSPSADSIIIFFANYLAYILPAIFIIILYFSNYPKRQKDLIAISAFLSGFIVRFGVVSIFRFFYHRPRPFLALDGVHQLLTENSYSFPSGHASFFFAFSFAIYLHNKKWGRWFLFASTLMVIARVIAGVHYPSDIIAGAVFGIIIGQVVHKLVEKFSK